jgi:hypothetical protein
VSDWLAGLLIGVVGGLIFLLLPPFGLVVVAIFTLLAIGRGNRSLALSGLLIGIGASWIGLLAAANARCTEFDQLPNQGCEAPDLTVWFAIGAGCLVIGAVLLMVGLRPGNRRT